MKTQKQRGRIKMSRSFKKERIMKIGIKIIWIILAISIIYIVYTIGMMRGLVYGVVGAQSKHNETVCDIIGRERDTDGFCLLRNETFKYRYYVDCGWEKFKIKGESNPPFLIGVAEDIRRWIYYPVLGC